MPVTKPKKLHLVQNTIRPARHKDRQEVEVPESIPEKPEYLKGIASDEWDQMVEKRRANFKYSISA
jgi:hypothetical protein